MTSFRSTQRGSSLLEVLVAILIMSFGLLGLAGMTASSLQYSKMAQYQTIGTQLAASYGDSVRANVPGFSAGNYDMTTAYTGATASITVPACTTATKCTSAELAAIDRAEWTNSLRRHLPAGSAYVTRDVGNNVLAADVWVMWADPSLGFGTSDMSVATTGGNQCPAAAIAGLASTVAAPRCMYFRISL